MSSARHLSWENFRSTVLVEGQQRVHRVSDSPYVEVFGDGVRGRVGIWLELPPQAVVPLELSKLTFVSAEIVNRENRRILELAMSGRALQRQFYHFATAVAERVVVEQRGAFEAVCLELECFSALLEQKAILGIERQIGLIGELVFLERLVSARGLKAIDAWLGPFGEPHDFRLRGVEFEVKTTVSPQRVHTIHGAEQLVATTGCELYLVSVLLGPPGSSDGFSLAEKVSEISTALSSNVAVLERFASAMAGCGFRETESSYYTRRFVLRRPLGIVPVDNSFPAITRPTIQIALGSLAPRVESLQYDVNVEGLEHEEGSTEFEKWVPRLAEKN